MSWRRLLKTKKKDVFLRRPQYVSIKMNACWVISFTWYTGFSFSLNFENRISTMSTASKKKDPVPTFILWWNFWQTTSLVYFTISMLALLSIHMILIPYLSESYMFIYSYILCKSGADFMQTIVTLSYNIYSRHKTSIFNSL